MGAALRLSGLNEKVLSKAFGTDVITSYTLNFTETGTWSLLRSFSCGLIDVRMALWLLDRYAQSFARELREDGEHGDSAMADK